MAERDEQEKAMMDEIISELLREIEDPKPTISDPELKRFLYREMVRLTMLVDENAHEPEIFGQMAALTKKARYDVNGDTDQQRLDQLLHLVFNELGFRCHFDEYFATDSLLLNRVLTKRRAMPITMAAILLYLAAGLDLPLYAVSFPTQLILRAELRDLSGRTVVRYVNPWNGDYLSIEQLEKWLEGEVHFGISVTPDLLKRAEPQELLERLETLFKMTLTREKKFAEALRVIEYRLTLSPEDPYEIRDRGMILASLDCYQAAMDDLSYFIDQCPDDPSAMMLKGEMQGLEQKSKAVFVH